MGSNPGVFLKSENSNAKIDKHTERRPCEDWHYVARSLLEKVRKVL